MSKTASIISNGIIVLIGKLSCNIVSFLTLMYVARCIGTENYGKISIVFAYIYIFQSIAQFGIDTVFVREVSRDPYQQDAWFFNAICCKLFLAVVAIVLSWVVVHFMNYPLEIKKLIILASFSMLFSFHSLIPGIFQIKLKTLNYVIPDLVIQLITSSLLFLSARNSYPISVIISIQAFGVVPLAIGYGLAATHVVQRRSLFSICFDKITLLLKEALPLFLSAIGVTVTMRLDQIFLYNIANSQELGVYAAAVRIVEMPNFIPGQILAVVFPILSATFLSSTPEFERVSWITYRVMSMTIIPVIIVIFFLSSEIVQLFYGAAFSAAARPLSILAFSLIFVFLGSVHSSIILAMGLSRYFLFITLIGGITSIAFYALLIPAFGTTGAAAASTISYSCVGMLPAYLFPKTKKTTILYYKAILVVLPAAFAMSLILYFRGEGLYAIVSITLALPLYLLTLFLTKAISGKEIGKLVRLYKDSQVKPRPPHVKIIEQES